jgi:rRNA-processing protein FCF1
MSSSDSAAPVQDVESMDFKAALLHEQPSTTTATELPTAAPLKDSEWPELGAEPAPEAHDATSASGAANQSMKDAAIGKAVQIKDVAIEKTVQLKDAVVHQTQEFQTAVREKGLQTAVLEKGTELKDVALTQGGALLGAAKETGVHLKDAAIHKTVDVKDAALHVKDVVVAQGAGLQEAAREKGYPAAVMEKTTALTSAALGKAAETGQVVLESGRPLAQAAYNKGVQLQQTTIGQKVTDAALSTVHFAEGTIDKFASDGQKQFIHNAVEKAGEVVQQVKTAVLGPQQTDAAVPTESRTH